MTRRGRGHDGQATVEFALVLPFVALLAALIVQVGLVLRAQVLVVHAAREGARAASVATGPRDDAARRAAERSSDRGTEGIAVEVLEDETDVTVIVRRRMHVWLPFLGELLPEFDVQSRATMRIEVTGASAAR